MLKFISGRIKENMVLTKPTKRKSFKESAFPIYKIHLKMINALPSPEILAQILENLNMEHNMASRLAVFRNAIYPKLAILIRAHEKPIR